VVLVSSGAVGLGAARLNLDQARLKDVTMRQACAAVGQSLLMNAYEQLFAAHQITPAQVLLTESDFTDHRRYLNLRRTMEKLLKLGVLPIINENDTVSTAELEYLNTAGAARIFSDNDRLAALVTSKLDADALVLLTNVDGLLDNAEGRERSVIAFVREVTPELKGLASGPSVGGRGGMLTKLEAAEIAMQSGGVAVIANGTKPDTLPRIFAGENRGTVFMSASRMPGKKRWIAYAAGVHGRVVVNDGAREAILKGKASLLSSGILRIEDSFEAHDVLVIADAAGREFARGIANYDSREAEEEARRARENSLNNENTAPREKQRALVTRDNIVVLESAKSAEAV
jgi:glutamate 5-kinase